MVLKVRSLTNPFELPCRGPRKFGICALAVILAIARSGGANGAEVKIVTISAYVFLEHAGKLSNDLVGGQGLVNAPRGGAPGGDIATALFLEFTFEGNKNASPKYASATVDLTQTNHEGQQIVTHKAFTNFIFGNDGLEHKALFIEAATCMPLAIDVHAGRTTKSTRLDFQCDIVRASN
jgi:hypothetical protein